MSTRDLFTDGPQAQPFINPWVVVTRNGIVVERFEFEHSDAAHDCARQLASAGDITINIYQVDSQIIPSPSVGDAIDSNIAGWVRIK